MKNFLYLVITDKIDNIFVRGLKFFLWALSLFYGGVIGIIKQGYSRGILKERKLPRPVISVGNITLGGVGKTPFVIFLAEMLKKQGKRPAVLIRGYMDESSSASDEDLVLRSALAGVPILCGADRTLSAKTFLQNNDVDVFILDDGFQHWRLRRDIDIVLIDAANPYGNGCLLPRGILREPLSALGRADILGLTKVDLVDKNALAELKKELQTRYPNKPLFEAVHQPVDFVDVRSQRSLPLRDIYGQRVGVFCSIASPQSLTKTLERLGCSIIKLFTFIDHYQYQGEDLEKITRSCKENKIGFVLTTHKDAVKIFPLLGHFDENLKIFYLKIEIALRSTDDVLAQRINHLLCR